jgi:hypothetical protein
MRLGAGILARLTSGCRCLRAVVVPEHARRRRCIVRVTQDGGVSKRVDILPRVEGLWDSVEDRDTFPFTVPAVRALDQLAFPTPVTFLVGENGAGKSTIVKAIAMAAELSPEGGNRDIRLSTLGSESTLVDYLRLAFGTRPPSAFFLRAETWFSTAAAYQGLMHHRGLDARSHGEQVIDGEPAVSGLSCCRHQAPLWACAGASRCLRQRGSGTCGHDRSQAEVDACAAEG